MRIKVCLGLVAGAALLAVAACGDDKKDPVCPVETDAAGVERADCANPACAEHPSCEICDDGIDNTGDGLVDCDDPFCAEHEACAEICDDGIDNTGNGLVDCADPACGESEACEGWICDGAQCVQECERQTPDCAGSPHAGLALTSICNQGRCEAVGLEDKDGEAKVVELTARIQVEGVAAIKGLRSAVVDVLYVERTGDEAALSCAEVVEHLRAGTLRDNPSINVAVRSEMEVQANEGATSLSIDLNRVPLHREDKPYLLVTHFYNGRFDGIAGRAQGALTAYACAAGVEAKAKEVTLRARNSCEPNEPGSCQDGWACRAGICMYECAITCNLNQTCRTIDGEDVCLRECGDSTPCNDGERCDQSFPWNQAACIPN